MSREKEEEPMTESKHIPPHPHAPWYEANVEERAKLDCAALDAIVDAFKAGRSGSGGKKYAELLDEIEAAIRTTGRVV